MICGGLRFLQKAQKNQHNSDYKTSNRITALTTVDWNMKTVLDFISWVSVNIHEIN